MSEKQIIYYLKYPFQILDILFLRWGGGTICRTIAENKLF